MNFISELLSLFNNHEIKNYNVRMVLSFIDDGQLEILFVNQKENEDDTYMVQKRLLNTNVLQHYKDNKLLIKLFEGMIDEAFKVCKVIDVGEV